MNARIKRLLKLAIAPTALLVAFFIGWLPVIPFVLFFLVALRIVVPLAWNDLSYILQTPRYRPSSSSSSSPQTDPALLADDQSAVADQEAEHVLTPGLAPLTLPVPIEDDEDEEEEVQEDDLGNLAQPHEDRPGTPVSGLLVQYEYVEQRQKL